jgi:hypothetical protein
VAAISAGTADERDPLVVPEAARTVRCIRATEVAVLVHGLDPPADHDRLPVRRGAWREWAEHRHVSSRRRVHRRRSGHLMRATDEAPVQCHRADGRLVDDDSFYGDGRRPAGRAVEDLIGTVWDLSSCAELAHLGRVALNQPALAGGGRCCGWSCFRAKGRRRLAVLVRARHHRLDGGRPLSGSRSPRPVLAIAGDQQVAVACWWCVSAGTSASADRKASLRAI